MRIRISVATSLLVLAASLAQAAPTNNPTAKFTLSSPSHIPGVTLKPGDYTIQVLNRLSDRVILRVDDTKGKVHETFLGVPNNQIADSSDGGPIQWSNRAGNDSYLKGWNFKDNRSVIEFVYPKADAVKIATANPAKVIAVDPASQGMEADKALAQDDMKVLSLWVLTLQEVGPNAPSGGIKAERYNLTASADYKPSIRKLPHTASLVPLAWLVGLLMILCAAGVRGLRLIHGRRIASSDAERRG